MHKGTRALQPFNLQLLPLGGVGQGPVVEPLRYPGAFVDRCAAERSGGEDKFRVWKGGRKASVSGDGGCQEFGTEFLCV